MLTVASWLAFVALCVAMVLSPGRNMMYLVSRSICQGARAGLIPLAGVLGMLAARMAIEARR